MIIDHWGKTLSNQISPSMIGKFLIFREFPWEMTQLLLFFLYIFIYSKANFVRKKDGNSNHNNNITWLRLSFLIIIQFLFETVWILFIHKNKFLYHSCKWITYSYKEIQYHSYFLFLLKVSWKYMSSYKRCFFQH